MSLAQRFCPALWGALAATCLWPTLADAQGAGRPRPDRKGLREPVYRVAQGEEKVADTRGVAGAEPANGSRQADQPQAGEHPLEPALQIAYTALDQIRANIKDYSATLVKRERVNGKLLDHEYMFLKVRHEPFSVYTYFLTPDKKKGQEAIYVKGWNNNQIAAHGVGIQKVIGRVNLEPTSSLAMEGQRYPITEIGLLRLVEQLIERGEQDKKYGECEVKFFKDTKIRTGREAKDVRNCTLIEATHPVPRKNFLFHVAKIYVDTEYGVPIRYEAYDWPSAAGKEPPLLEEYTYVNLKFNQGFTDRDFDPANPEYKY